MPRPEASDGPWGEAIDYWLKKKNWFQADLLRKILALKKLDEAKAAADALAAGKPPQPPRGKKKKKKNKGNKNTVSTAFLGRDCTTKTLRLIARALDVPLEDVLVSPERRSAGEERRRTAFEAAELAYRKFDMGIMPDKTPERPIDQKTKDLGVAIEDLEAAERQEVSSEKTRPRLGRKK